LPLLSRHRFIVNIRCDLIRRMSQQILNNLGVISVLPQQSRVAVTKSMEALCGMPSLAATGLM